MRQGKVYYNHIEAGLITETDDGKYTFKYLNDYFVNPQLPAISVTIPKNKQDYESQFLFPFFFNMLSEGYNKKVQSRHLKIAEEDYFGFLLKTAHNETVGAITVEELI